jgi:hypothetical protein
MILKIFKYKGRELVVQVDDQDAYLLEGTWHVANCGISHGMDKFYVRRTGPRPQMQSLYLHRVIAGIMQPGQVVDHKDGNGLNCCRGNLRVTTQPDNARRQIKKTQRGK